MPEASNRYSNIYQKINDSGGITQEKRQKKQNQYLRKIVHIYATPPESCNLLVYSCYNYTNPSDLNPDLQGNTYQAGAALEKRINKGITLSCLPFIPPTFGRRYYNFSLEPR